MVVAGSDGWYFFRADGAISIALGASLQPETTGTHSLDPAEQERMAPFLEYPLPVPAHPEQGGRIRGALYPDSPEEQGIRQLLAKSSTICASGRFTDFIDTKELLVRKKTSSSTFARTVTGITTARPWSTGRSSCSCSNGFPNIQAAAGEGQGRNGSRVFRRHSGPDEPGRPGHGNGARPEHPRGMRP